jgi:outer membrane immunogenic protein
MKKAAIGIAALAVLIGTPALAADMAVKAPPRALPVASAYNWTGWYVGGNAGYGWSDGPCFAFSPDNTAGGFLLNGFGTEGINVHSGCFNTSGFLGGGQLGYNWQFQKVWVASIEADINYSNVRGSGSFPATLVLPSSPSQPALVAAGEKLDWFGTVRARLGVLPMERLLVFATGGLAYGETNRNSSVTTLGAGFNQGVNPDGSSISCVTGACVGGAGSRTSAGWTAGGGLEYAIWNNVTVKAEYLYVNLGNQTIHLTTVPPASGNGSIAAGFSDAAFNMVRVGINYKFY